MNIDKKIKSKGLGNYNQYVEDEARGLVASLKITKPDLFMQGEKGSSPNPLYTFNKVYEEDLVNMYIVEFKKMHMTRNLEERLKDYKYSNGKTLEDKISDKITDGASSDVKRDATTLFEFVIKTTPPMLLIP